MLRQRDGALGLEFDFRPEPPGNERPRQPVHRKAEVVELAQMDVCADRARFEAGEQLLGLCCFLSHIDFVEIGSLHFTLEK